MQVTVKQPTPLLDKKNVEGENRKPLEKCFLEYLTTTRVANKYPN